MLTTFKAINPTVFDANGYIEYVDQPDDSIVYRAVEVDFFDDGGVEIGSIGDDHNFLFAMSSEAFDQIVAERAMYLNRIKD